MRATDKSRTEALSDGIFAVAITLLVLQITVPQLPAGAANRDLVRSLLDQWPSFVAFLISFTTTFVLWVNHHGLFYLVRGVDRPFLFANGFVVMLVTFVPFPTAVLAHYLEGEAANAAAAFYCGTYVMINAGYNLLWHTAAHRRLVRPDIPQDRVKKIRLAYHAGFFVYLTATVAAWFSAWVGVAICCSLWPVWSLLHYGAAGDGKTQGREPGDRPE
jgi:uncharacterized membrane protein